MAHMIRIVSQALIHALMLTMCLISAYARHHHSKHASLINSIYVTPPPSGDYGGVQRSTLLLWEKAKPQKTDFLSPI